MFEFLFILLLFFIGFTIFAIFMACGTYFLFGISIGYTVLGIGALLCASVFGLILLIAAIQIIVYYIREFKENHKK